jgi:hypothetical protein
MREGGKEGGKAKGRKGERGKQVRAFTSAGHTQMVIRPPYANENKHASPCHKQPAETVSPSWTG